MDRVEAVARAICVADKVDPDFETVGYGVLMPDGKHYKLWEARVKQAEAAIEADAHWRVVNLPVNPRHGSEPGTIDYGTSD
jgi:hypothetical protein